MFYDVYESLCKEKGVKPYTVAREIGLGTSNVAQWKKGSTPRPSILEKIAKYFGVPVAYFFGQKEPPPAKPEAADPVKQQLYGIIEKMSRGQLMLLLEKAQDIENL